MEHRYAAYLATLKIGEDAKSLSDYLGEGGKEIFAKTVEWGLSIAPPRREETLNRHLQAIRSGEDFLGISEIHPSWFLEYLKQEPPRIIGLILRHMPSKHVRYLLERLPRRTVGRLPKLIESFWVPREILEIIRRRFETHFLPVRISRITKPSFETLYYLRNEDLGTLIRELGLWEVALSLLGASKKVLRVVLNRFAMKEARRLLAAIKSLKEKDGTWVREARYTLLEMGSGRMGAQRFLTEVGLASLAKAFGKEDQELFGLLKQRLEPELAFLFKRYVEQNEGRAGQTQIEMRKQWVLERVEAMKEENLIQPLWIEKAA